MRFVKVIGLFIVLTFSLTGCLGKADQSSKNNDELKSADLSNQTDDSKEKEDYYVLPNLPLDKFELNDEEKLTVLQGKWEFVTKCLKENGFENKTPKPALSTVTELKNIGGFDRTWGVLTQIQANNGYKKVKGAVPDLPADADPTKSYLWDSEQKKYIIQDADSQAYTNAESECQMNVNDELIKVKNSNPDAVEAPTAAQIRMDSAQKAEQSELVLNAIAKWSECMQKNGYDFKTPEDAVNNNWDYELTDKEIKTAQSDFNCKQSTKLMDIYYQEYSNYQNELIKNQLPKLEADLKTEQKAIAWAEQLISTSK